MRKEDFDPFEEQIFGLLPEYRRKFGRLARNKLWKWLLNQPTARKIGIGPTHSKSFTRAFTYWCTHKGVFGTTALCQDGAMVVSGIRRSDPNLRRNFTEGFDVDAVGELGAIQRFSKVEFVRVGSHNLTSPKGIIDADNRAYFAVGSARSNQATQYLLDRVLYPHGQRVNLPGAFCWGDCSPNENALAVELRDVTDSGLREKIASGRAYGFRLNGKWHPIELCAPENGEPTSIDYGIVIARRTKTVLDVAAIGGSGPGTVGACRALVNALEYEYWQSCYDAGLALCMSIAIDVRWLENSGLADCRACFGTPRPMDISVCAS
jgi:hypothetical protein